MRTVGIGCHTSSVRWWVGAFAPVLLEHTDPTGRPCPLDDDDLTTVVFRIAIHGGLITAGAGTPKEQACATP